MKILLYGKNGQVGRELRRSLAVLGEVVALSSDSQDLCGNFTDLNGIAQTVRAVKPDVIVNAAAYTTVDKAESELELAHLINAQAPGVLAQEAHKIGAWMVHYSTDYVFDGSGEKPWRETDTPNPLNVYGASKWEGEKAVQAAGCRHLIFRSGWIYAVRGRNFVKTILHLGQERDSLSIVNDQIGAPTGAELVADMTAYALRAALQNSQVSGHYHLAAEGETSWYDYARFILDFAQQSGIEIKVKPDAVLATPSHDFPATAKRPLNSRLNTKKLQDTFGLYPPDWRVGVIRTLSELLEKTDSHPFDEIDYSAFGGIDA